MSKTRTYRPYSRLPDLLVLVRAILVSTGIFLTPAVGMAQPPTELPEELENGLARYQLLTDAPLSVIALNSQPDSREGQFLHAQALLDLGLRQLALEELQGLTNSDDELAGEVGLELARLAMQAGDLERAENWLDQTLEQLQGRQRQEGLFYKAELMRRKGELAGAASVLGEMGNSAWTGLGYFNLAVTHGARDSTASRPLVALRVAAATIGEEDPFIGKEVFNRSQLAGGLLAMREADYSKALSFLSKVQLDSYYAPYALYLHGLAYLEQGHVHKALQSLHRAGKFPLAFPGAPEAYIAMGQGFNQAGSRSQAVDAFQSAHAAFEQEKVVLEELGQSIQEQGAYATLVEASHQQDLEWFLDNSQAITAPRLAWLMRFMENPEAQDAVKRSAELEQIALQLQQKQIDMAVMERVLKDRLKTYRAISAGGIENDPAARLRTEAEGLRQRLDKLQHQRDKAVAEMQFETLASGTMSARLRKLEILETAAEYHDAATAIERLRRLRGISLWEAQKRFNTNRASWKAAVAGVREQIDEAEAKLDEFDADVASALRRTELLGSRLEHSMEEVAISLQQITALQERSDQLLKNELDAFIARQSARLTSLAVRSEQETAHLYEAIAVSQLEADLSTPEEP